MRVFTFCLTRARDLWRWPCFSIFPVHLSRPQSVNTIFASLMPSLPPLFPLSVFVRHLYYSELLSCVSLAGAKLFAVCFHHIDFLYVYHCFSVSRVSCYSTRDCVFLFTSSVRKRGYESLRKSLDMMSKLSDSLLFSHDKNILSSATTTASLQLQVCNYQVVVNIE